MKRVTCDLRFLAFTDGLFIKCCSSLFRCKGSGEGLIKTFWINPLPDPLQYLMTIPCTETTYFFPSETCCFDKQSDGKDGHPGIIMSCVFHKEKLA